METGVGPRANKPLAADVSPSAVEGQRQVDRAIPEHRMRIYLDDERVAPAGWVQARWPDEVIEYLKSGDVTELSLDHDLGDDERGTGYDVVLWLEEAVATRGFMPPRVAVHPANTSAKLKMEAGIRSIRRLAQANEDST